MTTSSEADTAVLALLATDAYLVPKSAATSGSPTTLWDGHVEDSDDSTKTVSAKLPYAAYFTTPGYPVNPRLGGTPNRAQEFQITSVGMTREQAAWLGDKVEALLHGARVTLAGRERRISRTDGNPFTARDDTWNRPGGGPLFSDVRRYVLAR